MNISSDFVNASNTSESSNNSQNTSGSSVESTSGIPSHKFVYQKKKIQTGKSKGQTKYVVSLEIGPYTYKRRVDAVKVGAKALFICTLSQLEIYPTSKET